MDTTSRTILATRDITWLLACLAFIPLNDVIGVAQAQQQPPTRVEEADAESVERYCSGIGAAANEARAAFLAKRLGEMEIRLKQLIEQLNTKKLEYEAVLRQRAEVMAKAEDGVVAMVAKMRPDVAGAHLLRLDEPIAAAILSKLVPRSASAILDELDPAKASRLTDAMGVGAFKPPAKKP